MSCAFNPPFFPHPFFLCFGPVHPTLPQAIFFPQIPSFWDLRSTLELSEFLSAYYLCVCQSELTEFVAEVTEFLAKLCEFSSEVKKRGQPNKWPPECLPSKFADSECAFPL